jgi:signal transduction histidine kinase
VPERVRLVGVSVFAAVVQVGATRLASVHQTGVRSLDALGVGLLLAGPAALLARRRWPLATYVIVFAITVAYWLLDYPDGPAPLSLLIAFVNLALTGQRAVAWTGLVIGYVVAAWITPRIDEGPWPDWGLAAGLAAWLALVAVLTELVRSWMERSAERARALEDEARRRASEERLRIARELHDVLAHNISMINVRAGVALHLIDDHTAAAPAAGAGGAAAATAAEVDLDQVRPALAAIKDASKEALGELRSVLDVLRQGEAAPLAPTAGLADLDRLVEGARGTGLDVRVEAPGPVEGLPAGLDLAAFRIVQEALTNVAQHAHANHAQVMVDLNGDVIAVLVEDDGSGFSADDARLNDPKYKGLASMRQRVEMFGGVLNIDTAPGRGTRVTANLPAETIAS